MINFHPGTALIIILRNRKIKCFVSAQSDQGLHHPSEEGLYPYSTKQRLASDWADAQADPSLPSAHRSIFWFCHAPAQMLMI